MYPELVEQVVMVTATSALFPQAVAWSEVQQQAIKLVPAWQNRNDEPGQGPKAGLAVARMAAMMIYQSDLSMQRRCGRQPVSRHTVRTSTPADDLGGCFAVEEYLSHQGNVPHLPTSSPAILSVGNLEKESMPWSDLASVEARASIMMTERT